MPSINNQKLNKCSPSFDTGDTSRGKPIVFGHRKGANTFTFTGTTNRDPFPGLNQLEKDNHFGQALYPNLMMSLSMDHVAAFILRPISPTKTMIDCRILFHPNEVAKSDFDPNDASEFWHLVNKQDWP